MKDTRSAAARQQDEQWAAFVRETQGGRRCSFDEQLAFFREVYAERADADGPPQVWRPAPEEAAQSNVARWMKELGRTTYDDLHALSAADRSGFWYRALQRLGIVYAKGPTAILDPDGDPRDPVWLPGAEMNIVDSCFRAPGDAPAVVSGREGTRDLTVTTYDELRRLVGRVAGGLRAQGFGPGDRIALYLPMTLECVAAYLGIIQTGAAAVSIADSFSPQEVAKRIEISGACGIVTVDAQIRAGKTLPMYDKVRQAEAPRAIVIAGAAVQLRDGDILWDDLLAADGAFPSEIGSPTRVANVLFSSGTTGTPKAIPWTHLTPIKCVLDGHFHQDIRPGDVVAWPTNIGWMMGPWLIFAGLVNRGTIALYEGAPNGAGFTRFVAEANVAMLGVVPSLVRAWRTGGHLDGRRWPGVRAFSSTGEPSNAADYLWLMSRTDYRAPVIEYLGGTEIGGGHITGTVVQPASPATFTTPALGIDFHLLTASGAPAKEGEAGELFLVPPSIGLSQTLLNANHADVYYSGCPAGPNGEILRRHGDRFVRLGQGFYKAEGRVDDTMNLGGIKVGSLELERVLATHAAVRECAAVGVRPEGDGAERLVVYVVLEGGAETAALRKELDAELARHLNPLFRIHEIIPTGELPRTASNKLMRRKLQERYQHERAAR